MNLNKTLLAGNLTRDPELRYTSGGKAVVNFSIAVNESYKTKDGEKKQKTAFIRCVAWEAKAENIAKYFTKGKAIYVEGRIDSSQYEDKDGKKREKTEVVVSDFQFVDSKSNGQTNTNGAPF